jgi:hypothetical protein
MYASQSLSQMGVTLQTPDQKTFDVESGNILLVAWKLEPGDRTESGTGLQLSKIINLSDIVLL